MFYCLLIEKLWRVEFNFNISFFSAGFNKNSFGVKAEVYEYFEQLNYNSGKG
jgi:hypothetical protein